MRTPDGQGRGQRNPVFLGEFVALGRPDQRLLTGLQWESPWGDEVVSQRHSEWITYARCQRLDRSWSLDFFGLPPRFATPPTRPTPAATTGS